MKITKSKLYQILLELIYLEDGLFKDKACDPGTLKLIRKLIEELKFWSQFMK